METITMVQARQLLEMITPLAKACVFTKEELLEITNVCGRALDRYEHEHPEPADMCDV